MSGAVSYGPDSGANGNSEYTVQTVTYVNSGSRMPITYAAGLPGSAPGVMPNGIVHQQQANVPMNAGYMAAGAGEPSMRQSVEGIPQVHHLQQHMAGGMQPGMQPGVMMAGQQPVPAMAQYAVQGGQPRQPQQYGVPVQFYPAVGQVAPAYMATHVQDFRFGGAPQFVMDGGGWHGEQWEEDFDESSGAVLYGNLEVKHRRRTTPEQLRVLEHWFSINPRPDNALREWLASELGITKRNVQVWFQNRRAKIKNQEKAREAAAADAKKEAAKNGAAVPDSTDGAKGATTPTPGGNAAAASTAWNPSSSSSANVTPGGTSNAESANGTHTTTTPVPTPLQSSVPSFESIPSRPSSSNEFKRQHPILSNVDRLNMGRRVSLAGGDEVSIEQWAAKRRMQMGQAPYQSSSVGNSPMGLAAAARRNSQPYPTQIITHHEDPAAAAAAAAASRSALPSPKISPNGRMPGALLFTAMRNNTLRRASMPGGGAQLISTTAFTPPRNASYVHPVPSQPPSNRPPRELSPIKDQDSEIDPALRATGGFISPSNGFTEAQLLSVPQADPMLQYSLNPGLGAFAPNSPLPNPTFSFGSAAPSMDHTQSLPGSATLDKGDSQHALFMALQRGRLGSIASVNSTTTNGTEGTATEGGSEVDWTSFGPSGFDPDIRRASAPADLLHNIGLLGISGNSFTPHGGNSTSSLVPPSPLASAYSQSADSSRSSMYDQPPLSAGLVSSTPGQGGGPYLPAVDNSPIASSAVPSEGPSPSAHQQVGQTLMPPPPVPSRQSMYSYSDTLAQYTNAGNNEFNDLNDFRNNDYGTLPSTLPSLPEPTAYTNGGDFPSSSNSASGADTLNFPSDFDLGFDLQDPSLDKDQLAFLAELTNDSGSDTVNVLV